MPSDDQQPLVLRTPDGQAHPSADGLDADPAAETKTPRYTLGQPHTPRTRTVDEALSDMDPEQLQQAWLTMHTMLGHVTQAIHTVLDQAAGIRSGVMTIMAVALQASRLSDAWWDQVASVLGTFASILKDLPTTIMRTEGPPNWNGLTDEELKAVIATATSGIPVAWVPRTAILRELLAAPTTDQHSVLDAHANDIVADCATAVSETRSGTFSTLANCLEEAVLTYRNGHLIASQALAASVFDTLLRAAVHAPVKTGYYSKVKKKIAEDPDWFPQAVAHLPALAALQKFDHLVIPTTFNRHAAAHAVSTEQYSPSNALISLMLASSILRQAHHTAHEVAHDDLV
ncbi:hypothetical protein JNUCC0626_32215 [Lentzea sp. JNUCC 0626]|uniref:hypothetical protein n=1 Tax=Lentzea sp. JNUCC 0626 TaxID=3367513 RepID=UPI00374A56E1